MSGFAALPGALDPQPRPLLKEDVAFSDEQMADQAALDLVIQDIAYAEQYRTEKSVETNMEFADTIYRAYVKPRVWPGTDVQRSNLGMPLVMETIDVSILPTVYQGFFSDPDKPFLLEEKGKTEPATALAASHILCWAASDEVSSFGEEIRKIMKSCLQYGVGVGKWGWASKTKTTYSYKRKGAPVTAGEGMGQTSLPTEEYDTVERSEVSHEIAHPTLEYVDLRYLLVDGGLRDQDIRKAKYVFQQNFITAYDLDEMSGDATYKNIPKREQLREILPARTEPTTQSNPQGQAYTQSELQAAQKDRITSADPLLQPLEILEYWTKDRVITVLQRRIVIRNEANEFGRIPFVSCSFIDVLNSFYGYGVAKLIGPEQLLQQGVVNTHIDGLALWLNPPIHRKKGLGAMSQTFQTAPGKVLADDAEINPLSVDPKIQEALAVIQASENRAVRRVGAQGGDNMPTQAMRTAEGVQAFTSGVANRLAYFIDCFARLVFIPVLEAFVQLAKDKLKPSQVQAILSEQDGQAFEGDVIDFFNGAYSLSVLSSTKLAARRAVANLIPMLIQLFSTEGFRDQMEVQGMKVDYAALIQKTLDLIGADEWKLIVPMTEEDKQRIDSQQKAAMAQMQMQQQQQQQKQQDALEQIEAKGTTQAGVAVVKHVLKETADKSPVTSGNAADTQKEIGGMLSGGM